jgi:hypothetical protein
MAVASTSLLLEQQARSRAVLLSVHGGGVCAGERGKTTVASLARALQ